MSLRFKRQRPEWTASVGLASAPIAVALVLLPHQPWARLLGAFLLACVSPGAMIMCWVDSGDVVAQACLTLVTSLSCLALSGAIMIWLSAWHPDVALYGFAAASAFSCGARTAIGRRAPLTKPGHDEGQPSGERELREGKTRKSRVRVGRIAQLDTGLMLVAVGVVAWIVGLAKTTPDNVGPSGLLLGSNAWLVAGIAGVSAGFLYQILTDKPREWRLWLNLVVLIVVVHGAVPIIYRSPEYAWVYKHIGVISGFQRYGRITDPSDIYQEWPTFFAGVALVASFAHVNAVIFAAWAPAAFELMNAALVVAILRSLGIERKRLWLSVLLYEGFVAWVGQDYLSPQAFAYVLWLGVLLIVLRWLLFSSPGGLYAKSRLIRLRARVFSNVPSMSPVSPRTRTFAICLVTLLYVAIVTAHQITPYIGLVSLAGLAACGLIRPRWIILVLCVVTFGFFALHYHLISQEYGGLFGGDPLANASGVSAAQDTSSYQILTSHIVTAMAALMWGGSFLIVVRHVLAPGRVLVPALLAFAPFAVTLGSSYGGEVIYRVYLFSAPWCALLIAGQLLKFRPRIGVPTIVAAAGLALFAGVDGAYALVPSSAFTVSELQASQWLYRHIPKGSLIALPSGQFPTLETATYNDYPVEVMPASTQVVPKPWVNEGNALQVSNWIASFHRRQAYFVVSQSMSAWNLYMGPPNGYDQFIRELRVGELNAVPVYKNGSTTIYHVSIT